MELKYNKENRRYGVVKFGCWKHEGLHCGQGLKVLINEKWLESRLEMDWSTGEGVWYLVGTGLKGNELEGLEVVLIKGEE